MCNTRVRPLSHIVAMLLSPENNLIKRCLAWIAQRSIVLPLAMCLASPATSAAPIATSTALPLSMGEFIVREQFVVTHASDLLAGLDRHVDRFEARTVLGYGFTSRLAVFGVLPVAKINRTPGDSDSGLGDSALFARYELFRSDSAGRTFRIAPFAGVRLPTGSAGKTGDGSVDVFGGVIATLASTLWVLDSQVRHDFNRKAKGFERGDSTSLETSFQYRLSPGKITLDTNAFVFGILELSANYYERNRVGGESDLNSGGFILYLTSGLQYATRRWIADLGVRTPIVNDLHGSALEPDYSILTSIRFNF